MRKHLGTIIGMVIVILFMLAAAKIEGTLRLDLLP